jgi:hypothetical protein
MPNFSIGNPLASLQWIAAPVTGAMRRMLEQVSLLSSAATPVKTRVSNTTSITPRGELPDRKRPPMPAAPNEILAQITEEVAARGDWEDVQKLRRVNKQFDVVAGYTIRRANGPSSVHQLNKLLPPPPGSPPGHPDALAEHFLKLAAQETKVLSKSGRVRVQTTTHSSRKAAIGKVTQDLRRSSAVSQARFIERVASQMASAYQAFKPDGVESLYGDADRHVDFLLMGDATESEEGWRGLRDLPAEMHVAPLRALLDFADMQTRSEGHAPDWAQNVHKLIRHLPPGVGDELQARVTGA